MMRIKHSADKYWILSLVRIMYINPRMCIAIRNPKYLFVAQKVYYKFETIKSWIYHSTIQVDPNKYLV